jgi:hypothetical protein
MLRVIISRRYRCASGRSFRPCCRAAWSRQAPHAHRILQDQPAQLALTERLDQLRLASKPTSWSLPVRPAASSASSMPKVVDSFGVKMPCTLLKVDNRFSDAA